jgi:DNA-binding Lrp family transcriptional regulator
MPTAYVLMQTDTGSEVNVLKALRKVEGVDETYLVYRVHDIIAKVKADKMDELKEIVTHRIRRLDKVTSILTMTVIEA